MSRSLTTLERNYIQNLPLTAEQKNRIEAVWCKSTKAIITTNQKTTPNYWANVIQFIIMLSILIYGNSPHQYVIFEKTLQVLGWIAAIGALVIYIFYLWAWSHNVILSLSRAALRNIYGPTKKSFYIYHGIQLTIEVLLCMYGFQWLASFLFIATTVFPILIGKILFRHYTKRALKVDADSSITLQIHLIKEYDLVI